MGCTDVLSYRKSTLPKIHDNGFPRGSCLLRLPSDRVRPRRTASYGGSGGVAIALAKRDEGKASAPFCGSTRGPSAVFTPTATPVLLCAHMLFLHGCTTYHFDS